MKIKDIYKTYGVPPNLQEHMFRVTKIALFICDNWSGNVKLDRNKVKKSALLHDMGNIVKFDFKNSELFGLKAGKVNRWKKKRKEIISKYGTDDHLVTKKILLELGIDKNIITIILSKSFGNSIDISKSNDWTLKTLLYSDLRALPTKIGTLKARFKDIVDRMPKYSNRPDIDDLFNACREIENSIQQNVNIDLGSITEKTIEKENENLTDSEI